MLTVPEMLEPLVFCTVNVRSAVLPVAIEPKPVAVEGVTLKSAWATPVAAALHVLSLPELSTAVTRAKYVVPALRPAIPVETVWPAAGVVVEDATVKNDPLGQAGADVAK